MAGFLDTLLGNPDQTAALGLLGAAAMAGNAPGGFQAASGLLAAAPERQLRLQMLTEDLAMKRIAEKRAQQMFEMQQEAFRGVPGAGVAGPSQPAIPGGQSGPLGSGTFGIPMPGQVASATPQSSVAAELARVERMAIAGVPGAKEALEAFKFRNTPQQVSAGGYSRDPITGTLTYNTDPTKGMNFDGKRITGIPGYSEFLTQQALATEGPKALLGAAGRVNLRKNTDGTESPRSELDENPTLQSILRGVYGPGPQLSVPSQPQVMPRPQPAPPQAQPSANRITPDDQRARDAESIQILQAEINAEKNPAARANLQRELDRMTTAQSRPGFPTPTAVVTPGLGYGKTTAQQTAEEVAKVKAVKDAEAAAGRDAKMAAGAVNSADTLSYIKEARALFKKGPTASGIGSLVDSGANLFGASTKGADAAAQLETLSGWMTSNVPRMEGPQSNFDVQQYKTMAGLVGDNTKPLSQRMAALDTLEKLQQKYAHLNGAAAPSSGAGSFDDAEKEARYQAWKRSQGK